MAHAGPARHTCAAAGRRRPIAPSMRLPRPTPTSCAPRCWHTQLRPAGQRVLRDGNPPDIARIKGWCEASAGTRWRRRQLGARPLSPCAALAWGEGRGEGQHSSRAEIANQLLAERMLRFRPCPLLPPVLLPSTLTLPLQAQRNRERGRSPLTPPCSRPGTSPANGCRRGRRRCRSGGPAR